MIPTLSFGRTNHVSTRTIFGAAALWGANEEEGERALEVVLRHSINHIDTAASYGRSERRVGAWMPRHRDKFFLATKTGERTYEKARDQIRHSLERLQTDHVDLIQLHNLVDETEWETALGPGGALEARLNSLLREEAAHEQIRRLRAAEEARGAVLRLERLQDVLERLLPAGGDAAAIVLHKSGSDDRPHPTAGMGMIGLPSGFGERTARTQPSRVACHRSSERSASAWLPYCSPRVSRTSAEPALDAT